MVSPRSILAFCLSLLLLVCAHADPDALNATAVVTVTQGRLSGVAGSRPGITVYRGIPFAAAPVGDLRWRPPQSPPAWKGMRRADGFCASCVQEIRRSYLPWTEEYMFRNDVSEDCLALNIWTPARTSADKLPVFVYIHGGAYFSGSGEVLLYDGEGLAAKGVIVVTINYRLGIFGFLAHPELTAESPHQSSGNYALLDMIAALHWVQDNIAAFGGDPARVTIGGQSAGAGAVHHLISSPLARGLFHGAIAQSGPWRHDARSMRLAEAETQGADFAQAIGAPSLAGLRALSADELFKAYQRQQSFFRPIVDGWVVPDQVTAVHERGGQIDVPLLTGWTADERSSRADYGRATRAELLAHLTSDLGPKAAAFLALYPVSNDSEAAAAQIRGWRDLDRAELAWWTALRARHGQARDWTYYFDRAIPWPEHPEYGAFHSGDLPYSFNNLDLMPRPWEPLDRRLADLTSEYWANFIKRGDPNGPGLPPWPDDNAVLMRLGRDSAAEPVLSQDKLELFLGSGR